MSRPVVLALDIALRRTGWAVGWLGMQRPFWGVHEIAGDWDGREGEHLHAWRRFIEARIGEHDVTDIVMELPFIDAKAISALSVVARSRGVIAGLPAAAVVARVAGSGLEFTPLVPEGSVVEAGTRIATESRPARASSQTGPSAQAGTTRVSGPGQTASVSLWAYAGASLIHDPAAVGSRRGSATCTITGCSEGRPFTA